jgi:EAL domain-containing protein (putative c-di-GMP-specific phosphodiesterase class I)/PAS domain-containing protein
MEDSVRVLVVEHRHADHRIAKQLLTDYDLDFSWRSVASTRELRAVARDFNPTIVLCTDDISITAGHALLGAMRLLCSRTPVILESSVHDIAASGAGDRSELFLKTVRQSPNHMARDSVAGAAPSQHPRDIAHLRWCFSSVLESSSEPIVVSDADGWVSHANSSACRELEEAGERCLGTLLGAPFAQCSRSFNWLDAARDSDPGPTCSTKSNAGSHHLAYFDHRTGIATPVHMNDLIGCLSSRARARHTALALVALNVSRTRIPADASIDASGHGATKSINSDLLSAATCYGSIVQISADDFLLVLPDLCGPADAAVTVQGVLDSIEQTPEAGPVLRTPDVQRHHLRTSAVEKSPYRHQSRPLAVAILQHGTKRPVPLEMELGDALQRHALSVHFQPQYDLKSGRGCGVEALARWVLSTGDIIPPSVFIPVAERAGLIHDLGAWVLQSACESTVAWCGRSAQPPTLSVNVSALQIDSNFCSLIGRTLKQFAFPAQQLELEITESALIANTELTIEYMNEWKRLGVRIAVDDFGTGYSSLNYLSRLPIDRLKLDQSLVQMMTQSSKSAAVLRSIVSLGAELGVDVMAEGVETELQFQMLTDLGCPRVQGYLLGRPMPASQAQVVLKKSWGNRPAPEFRPIRVALEECHAH